MFARASLALVSSLLALGANAWLLEFWAEQSDCNYRMLDGGRPEAPDISRGGLDHESNNCMMMAYNPVLDGFLAMKVTDWTPDCAIAFWSDKVGMSPCNPDMPFEPDTRPQRRPDHVFTLKSPEAILETDSKGNAFVCITSVNEYVQTNTGQLGYVSYSCGGNGTLLTELDNLPAGDPDPVQVQSIIESISSAASATTTTVETTTRKNATTTAGAPTRDVTLVTITSTTRKSTFTTVVTRTVAQNTRTNTTAAATATSATATDAELEVRKNVFRPTALPSFLDIR
ncbi:hypothetical protein B0T16DRAFT_407932 [Cercophora newfieldiana]|uniref:Uncharacterized protein n=1 Tax=Cercophora newfieldiana TaxID=92897 RepID=A0AA39YAY6_9PEZI|nr:hypothetical protein B0T16DRAFT_407932 [Cercophora newfieldiana]